jgi:hypothetical protein
MWRHRNVLEVATICVQTGLNPARHILESPCFPVSVNSKHSLLQSIPIHFPTILCELTHYTNTHEQQPYFVGTLSQMTERSAERRVRQETDWLAGGPLLCVATIRRTIDTILFISHTTNVLLFKFHCNIFIDVRIIKEMPGSVVSGTLCRIPWTSLQNFKWPYIYILHILFNDSGHQIAAVLLYHTNTCMHLHIWRL